MLDRFTGADGERLLIEVLARQPLVEGDRELASALARVARLEEYQPGSRLMAQDGDDNDVCFLGACLFSDESRCGPPVCAGWMLRRGESQLVRPGAQLSGSWGRRGVW